MQGNAGPSHNNLGWNEEWEADQSHDLVSILPSDGALSAYHGREQVPAAHHSLRGLPESSTMRGLTEIGTIFPTGSL